MVFSFKINSRGFLVEKLQEGLGIAADGIFGPMTRRAVEELQGRMRGRKMAVSGPGEAGAAEFGAVGLEWPSDFERGMNLVSGFEGTSFGDCNIRDIDGAGLTLGIAGFTTKHGEVQELIARYVSLRPECLESLSSATQRDLAGLFARGGSAAAWKTLFFGKGGRVLRSWVEAFSGWGRCGIMRKVQLEMAREKFWKPAVKVAAAHGFVGLQAECFFLDVAVQNGGWRRCHLERAAAMEDWVSGDVGRALVVAARAVSACAVDRWKNDVLSRKMAIARGCGTVHGRLWDLKDYGLI